MPAGNEGFGMEGTVATDSCTKDLLMPLHSTLVVAQLEPGSTKATPYQNVCAASSGD